MKALISGQAGAYAYQTGAFAVLNRVAEGAIFESDMRRIPYAFAGNNDVVEVDVKSPADAERLMTIEWLSARAVRHLTILFDGRESADERCEVAAELEQLFADPVVVERAERQMFAGLLPMDIADAVESAIAMFARVRGFVTNLLQHQEHIRRTILSYEDVQPDLFSSRWPKAAVREHAIDNGWFRDVARAIAQGADRINFLKLKMQTDRQIDGVRTIVDYWIDGLGVALEKKNRATKLENLPEELFADVELRDGAGARQAREQALSQIAAIVDRLRSGDLGTARKFAAELADSQLSARYAAISLCNLSHEAKGLQLWPLQLEWAEKAVEVNPTDPRVFGHLVDALIEQRRFVEASAALEQASALGESHFAEIGKARILRGQARFVEALQTYIKVRDHEPDHPEVFHAWAGAAGTLREMGDLDASLQMYDEALLSCPDEPILQVGRAATLVALGRMAEALRVYGALEKRPSHVLMGQSGRASVWKATGELHRAAEAFEQVSLAHPYDPFSANELADVWRLQGKLDQALARYKENQVRFPFTVQSFVGAADVYRDMGSHAHAIDELREALNRFPDDTYVKANLASYIGSDAAESTLSSLDALITDYPQMFFARTYRAEILRRLGRYDLAMKAFEDILDRKPDYLPAANGKASLLLVMGNVSKAIDTLPKGPPKSRDEWRSYLLKGMALARSGKLQPAVAHLKIGIAKVPFDREARLMKAALASIHLSNMQAPAALKTTAEIVQPDILGVIRLHALAFERRTAQARRAYEATADLPDNLVVLRDEIAKRYGVIPGRSVRDMKWIVREEQDHLILAA